MERTAEERRHNDWKKAIRKQRITQSWWSSTFGEYYPSLHYYVDNKIHCSCPLCRVKTTNKGKHKSAYLPTYNPPIHDKKQLIDSIDDLMLEEQLEE